MLLLLLLLLLMEKSILELRSANQEGRRCGLEVDVVSCPKKLRGITLTVIWMGDRSS